MTSAFEYAVLCTDYYDDTLATKMNDNKATVSLDAPLSKGAAAQSVCSRLRCAKLPTGKKTPGGAGTLPTGILLILTLKKRPKIRGVDLPRVELCPVNTAPVFRLTACDRVAALPHIIARLTSSIGWQPCLSSCFFYSCTRFREPSARCPLQQQQ